MRPIRQLKLRVTVLFVLIVCVLYQCYRWTHPLPAPQIKHLDGTHALTDTEAQHLCSLVNWDVYKSRQQQQQQHDAPPRRIYDLFLVNTELDWVEIRLNELYPHVDYFIIAEADTSFTGNPKPLYLKESWDHFSKFHDKLIHHTITGNAQNEKSVWDHEGWQRDALLEQVFPLLNETQAPHLGDVILVSDLDEIPRPSTLTLLKTCDFPRRVTLRSRFYYYSFQWLHRGRDWSHPQATYFEGIEKTIKPDALRYYYDMSLFERFFGSRTDLWNASWHCSSCFSTVSQMQNKIHSFSHTEFDRAEFKDAQQVVRRVRNGLDLFDRWGEKYDRVEGNLDMPGYLKKNPDRFAYMLDRDPENANFRDYDEGLSEG